MACKAENNIPAVGREEAARGRTISWMQVLPEESEDRLRFLPRPCLQCDDPPCIKVCPVYATYRNPEGIVAQIYARCIGCRFCMAACPYGARSFNFVDPRPHVAAVNPDYPTRTRGVVEKCDFCEKRLADGRQPACVEACPGKALMFGDLNDENSQVRRVLRERMALQRRPELGAGPSVFYLV
jgi:molybdopterin-containing oxidoreductase family iron-sulfur binding subunit